MSKMKAILRYAPDILVPEMVDIPSCSDDDMLIQNLVCGICYTESESYKGIKGLIGGTDAPLGVRAPVGRVVGHEACGVVAEVGANVKGFAVGDRIVMSPATNCGGDCFTCRHGTFTTCTSTKKRIAYGFFAEYSVCHPLNAYKIEGVGDYEGAAIESMSQGSRAARLLSRIGDNTVFLGMEDANFGAYEMIKDCCSNIVVVEAAQVRRYWLEKIGAKHVVDPDETDPVEYIKGVMPFGADTVYIAAEASIPETRKFLHTAYSIVRPEGNIVFLRIYGDDFWHGVPHNIGWMKNVHMHWSAGWGDENYRGGKQRGDIQVLSEWIADGRVRADALFTHIVGLNDLNSQQDMDVLFDMLPYKTVKAAVNISSQQIQKNPVIL